MNPISHAEKPTRNNIINSRTGNYEKKLGTSNNIFVKDTQKDFLVSPTKGKAQFNEFQSTANIFKGYGDKKPADEMSRAKKYTNTKVKEIVGNAPLDHSTRLRHFETGKVR